MALTVSISHPQFPDDTEFGVAGAFVVPNNGSVELTEEQELAFAINQQRLVSDLPDVFEVSGTGSVTEVPPPVDDRTPEERGIVTEDTAEVPPEPEPPGPTPESVPEGGES
jgi:hypothetical protein